MNSPQTPYQKAEAGNILIYILGAIFLLGILIITLKSSNTPGSNIDEETLILRVSEIQEYGAELESAVSLVLRNGHSESDIRFAHPNAASAYGDITDTPSRQIFHRNGGAAVYRDIPNGIQVTATPWHFTGVNRVEDIGINDANGGDLLFMINNVTPAFCMAINDKNDIPNPSDQPVIAEEDFEINTPFTGTYANTGRLVDAGSVHLPAHREGCLEGDGTPPSDTYHYYRVLLPR